MGRMSTEQANAVNLLASYVVATDPAPPAAVVRALETLANKANHRTQNGWDKAAVRRQWPDAFSDPTPTQ
jgi:hypothetical protein